MRYGFPVVKEVIGYTRRINEEDPSLHELVFTNPYMSDDDGSDDGLVEDSDAEASSAAAELTFASTVLSLTQIGPSPNVPCGDIARDSSKSFGNTNEGAVCTRPLSPAAGEGDKLVDDSSQESADDQAAIVAFEEAVRLHGNASNIRRVLISSRALEVFTGYPMTGPDGVDIGGETLLRSMSLHLRGMEELEFEKRKNWMFVNPMGDLGLPYIAPCISRLRRLDIACSVRTWGLTEEVTNAIQGAVHLEELRFRHIWLGVAEHCHSILTPMVEALATLGSLRIVELRVKTYLFNEELVSVEALRTLLRSTSLEEVSLVNMWRIQQHTEVFAEELGTNTLLQKVDLSGNKCGIEGLEAILSVMKQQFIVHQFRLDNSIFPFDKPYDAASRSLRSAVSCFAKLNAAGRQRIINNRNSSMREWLSLLEVAANDPEAMFYLLKLFVPQCLCANN